MVTREAIQEHGFTSRCPLSDVGWVPERPVFYNLLWVPETVHYCQRTEYSLYVHSFARGGGGAVSHNVMRFVLSAFRSGSVRAITTCLVYFQLVEKRQVRCFVWFIMH